MKKICLLCEKKKFKLFYKIKSFPIYFGAIPKNDFNKIKKFPLEISYCKNCLLVQQTKKISEKVMNKVYSSKYYNCPSPKKSGLGDREIQKFWKFFRSINQKKGKILEIASFDGYLLGMMKKIGWEVYGCDPSAASKVAKRKFGDKIKNSFYKAGLYKKNSFDVIVFRNLLEHMYDIKKFLKDVSFSLKNNGHIFIDIPNIKSIIKSGSFGVFFHQHVSYFSKSTIKNALENNGFKVKKIFEGNPNLFVYAQKKDSLNQKLYKKNDFIFLSKNIEKSEKIKNKILKIFKDKKTQKIVLFGMSALATSIINFLPKNLKKKIILLCDNDKLKHSKLLSGINKKIYHPKKLRAISFDKILICSYFFKNEIAISLKKYVKDKKKLLFI
jgi:2-polyprenyl-3-methyl-5-hydroxy-6-metoxy-1,4-benzoquinol methylase